MNAAILFSSAGKRKAATDLRDSPLVTPHASKARAAGGLSAPLPSEEEEGEDDVIVIDDEDDDVAVGQHATHSASAPDLASIIREQREWFQAAATSDATALRATGCPVSLDDPDCDRARTLLRLKQASQLVVAEAGIYRALRTRHPAHPLIAAARGVRACAVGDAFVRRGGGGYSSGEHTANGSFLGATLAASDTAVTATAATAVATVAAGAIASESALAPTVVTTFVSSSGPIAPIAPAVFPMSCGELLAYAQSSYRSVMEAQAQALADASSASGSSLPAAVEFVEEELELGAEDGPPPPPSVTELLPAAQLQPQLRAPSSSAFLCHARFLLRSELRRHGANGPAPSSLPLPLSSGVAPPPPPTATGTPSTLSARESALARVFLALSDPAAALLARLGSRKGPWFRVASFMAYPEVQSSDAPADVPDAPDAADAVDSALGAVSAPPPRQRTAGEGDATTALGASSAPGDTALQPSHHLQSTVQELVDAGLFLAFHRAEGPSATRQQQLLLHAPMGSFPFSAGKAQPSRSLPPTLPPSPLQPFLPLRPLPSSMMHCWEAIDCCFSAPEVSDLLSRMGGGDPRLPRPAMLELLWARLQSQRDVLNNFMPLVRNASEVLLKFASVAGGEAARAGDGGATPAHAGKARPSSSAAASSSRLQQSGQGPARGSSHASSATPTSNRPDGSSGGRSGSTGAKASGRGLSSSSAKPSSSIFGGGRKGAVPAFRSPVPVSSFFSSSSSSHPFRGAPSSSSAAAASAASAPRAGKKQPHILVRVSPAWRDLSARLHGLFYAVTSTTIAASGCGFGAWATSGRQAAETTLRSLQSGGGGTGCSEGGALAAGRGVGAEGASFPPLPQRHNPGACIGGSGCGGGDSGPAVSLAAGGSMHSAPAPCRSAGSGAGLEALGRVSEDVLASVAAAAQAGVAAPAAVAAFPGFSSSSAAIAAGVATGSAAAGTARPAPSPIPPPGSAPPTAPPLKSTKKVPATARAPVGSKYADPAVQSDAYYAPSSASAGFLGAPTALSSGSGSAPGLMHIFRRRDYAPYETNAYLGGAEAAGAATSTRPIPAPSALPPAGPDGTIPPVPALPSVAHIALVDAAQLFRAQVDCTGVLGTGVGVAPHPNSAGKATAATLLLVPAVRGAERHLRCPAGWASSSGPADTPSANDAHLHPDHSSSSSSSGVGAAAVALAVPVALPVPPPLAGLQLLPYAPLLLGADFGRWAASLAASVASLAALPTYRGSLAASFGAGGSSAGGMGGSPVGADAATPAVSAASNSPGAIAASTLAAAVAGVDAAFVRRPAEPITSLPATSSPAAGANAGSVSDVPPPPPSAFINTPAPPASVNAPPPPASINAPLHASTASGSSSSSAAPLRLQAALDLALGAAWAVVTASALSGPEELGAWGSEHHGAAGNLDGAPSGVAAAARGLWPPGSLPPLCAPADGAFGACPLSDVGLLPLAVTLTVAGEAVIYEMGQYVPSSSASGDPMRPQPLPLPCSDSDNAVRATLPPGSPNKAGDYYPTSPEHHFMQQLRTAGVCPFTAASIAACTDPAVLVALRASLALSLAHIWQCGQSNCNNRYSDGPPSPAAAPPPPSAPHCPLEPDSWSCLPCHPWLHQLTPAAVFSTLLWEAMDPLEKGRRYAATLPLLSQLVALPYTPHRSGRWWDRLSLNTSHLGLQADAFAAALAALRSRSTTGPERLLVLVRALYQHKKLLRAGAAAEAAASKSVRARGVGTGAQSGGAAERRGRAGGRGRGRIGSSAAAVAFAAASVAAASAAAMQGGGSGAGGNRGGDDNDDVIIILSQSQEVVGGAGAEQQPGHAGQEGQREGGAPEQGGGRNTPRTSAFMSLSGVRRKQALPAKKRVSSASADRRSAPKEQQQRRQRRRRVAESSSSSSSAASTSSSSSSARSTSSSDSSEGGGEDAGGDDSASSGYVEIVEDGASGAAVGQGGLVPGGSDDATSAAVVSLPLGSPQSAAAATPGSPQGTPSPTGKRKRQPQRGETRPASSSCGSGNGGSLAPQGRTRGRSSNHGGTGGSPRASRAATATTDAAMPTRQGPLRAAGAPVRKTRARSSSAAAAAASLAGGTRDTPAVDLSAVPAPLAPVTATSARLGTTGLVAFDAGGGAEQSSAPPPTGLSPAPKGLTSAPAPLGVGAAAEVVVEVDDDDEEEVRAAIPSLRERHAAALLLARQLQAEADGQQPAPKHKKKKNQQQQRKKPVRAGEKRAPRVAKPSASGDPSSNRPDDDRPGDEDALSAVAEEEEGAVGTRGLMAAPLSAVGGQLKRIADLEAALQALLGRDCNVTGAAQLDSLSRPQLDSLSRPLCISSARAAPAAEAAIFSKTVVPPPDPYPSCHLCGAAVPPLTPPCAPAYPLDSAGSSRSRASITAATLSSAAATSPRLPPITNRVAAPGSRLYCGDRFNPFFYLQDDLHSDMDIPSRAALCETAASAAASAHTAAPASTRPRHPPRPLLHFNRGELRVDSLTRMPLNRSLGEKSRFVADMDEANDGGAEMGGGGDLEYDDNWRGWGARGGAAGGHPSRSRPVDLVSTSAVPTPHPPPAPVANITDAVCASFGLVFDAGGRPEWGGLELLFAREEDDSGRGGSADGEGGETNYSSAPGSDPQASAGVVRVCPAWLSPSQRIVFTTPPATAASVAVRRPSGCDALAMDSGTLAAFASPTPLHAPDEADGAYTALPRQQSSLSLQHAAADDSVLVRLPPWRKPEKAAAGNAASQWWRRGAPAQGSGGASNARKDVGAQGAAAAPTSEPGAAAAAAATSDVVPPDGPNPGGSAPAAGSPPPQQDGHPTSALTSASVPTAPPARAPILMQLDSDPVCSEEEEELRMAIAAATAVEAAAAATGARNADRAAKDEQELRAHNNSLRAAELARRTSGAGRGRISAGGRQSTGGVGEWGWEGPASPSLDNSVEEVALQFYRGAGTGDTHIVVGGGAGGSGQPSGRQSLGGGVSDGSADPGGWRGLHCEGAPLSMLVSLLLWDVIFWDGRGEECGACGAHPGLPVLNDDSYFNLGTGSAQQQRQQQQQQGVGEQQQQSIMGALPPSPMSLFLAAAAADAAKDGEGALISGDTAVAAPQNAAQPNGSHSPTAAHVVGDPPAALAPATPCTEVDSGPPQGLHLSPGPLLEEMHPAPLRLLLPGTFISPYQDGPLDLDSRGVFAANRAALLQRRLRDLTRADGAWLVRQLAVTWREHEGQACRGVAWDRYPLPFLALLALGLGGPSLACLCEAVAFNHKQLGAGMPDLLLWRVLEVPAERGSGGGAAGDTQCRVGAGGLAVPAGPAGSAPAQEFTTARAHAWGSSPVLTDESEAALASLLPHLTSTPPARARVVEVSFVEVKGPRDSLSEKQHVWLRLLLAAGVDARVCKISEPGKG